MSIAVTLLALLVEATLGYPDRVLRAIGHPVMWLGRMIQWLDVTLNRETSSDERRKAAGFAAAFLIIFWFGTQFLSGITSLGPQTEQTSGVAVWAHIGGFICGLILVEVLRPRNRRPVFSY